MRAFIYLALLSSVSLLTACSNTDEKGQLYDYEGEYYEAAQGQLRRGAYEQAIQNLQNLEEYFPFGTYAEQAQLELIYAYYMSNEPEAATAAADRFIRLHPRHRNVDYAFYMKGLSSFTQDTNKLNSWLGIDPSQRDPGAARESFAHFAQLLARYPDSIYAPDAEKRMIYLRNLLARYEIHVANYYFKRGAYVAATNRGRYVVENFQNTPAVADALAVMAQGYHLLELPELSENAQKALKLNYADHPALEDGEFNFQYTLGEKSLISTMTFGLFDKAPSPSFDSRDVYNPQFK